MPWDIKRIGSLLKSSADRPAGPLSRTAVAASAAAAASELDTYSGVNIPGQLWNVYKSKKNDTANEFNLEKKLTDLLQPSTSSTAVWLEKRREGQPSLLPAYLRLKQKPLNKNEWLVDAEKGELHNGARFPLFITTKNSSHRSATGFALRREKWRLEEAKWVNLGTGKTAVAAGASWWMSASSSSTPAWLEKRRADDLGADSVEATMNSLAKRACAAGVGGIVEVIANDRDHAAPTDEHRSPHQCGWGAQWWSWSDWDWSGAHTGIGKTTRVGGDKP
jgi:hypothetical protein